MLDILDLAETHGDERENNDRQRLYFICLGVVNRSNSIMLMDPTSTDGILLHASLFCNERLNAGMIFINKATLKKKFV